MFLRVKDTPPRSAGSFVVGLINHTDKLDGSSSLHCGLRRSQSVEDLDEKLMGGKALRIHQSRFVYWERSRSRQHSYSCRAPRSN